MSNASQPVAPPGDSVDYELVFASDPHPALLVGIDDRFVILAASASYLELHHTSRPSLVGKSLLEWLGASGEDSQLRASLVHARETRSIHEMKVGADGHRIIHRPICGPDAEVRYLVHRVEIPGGVTAGAQLDAIFRRAPVAFAILRGADDIVELANPTALQLWGLTEPAEVVGRPFFEAVPEGRNQGLEELLRQVRDRGEPHVGREVPMSFRRREAGHGGLRYLDVVYQPLEASGAGRDVVVWIAADVTAQVKARQRVANLMRELEGADERKDEFLATLAHELRNPMAAISTALSLLERSEGDPARVLKHRETARRQINNLVRLVDDLLDVARVTRGAVDLKKEEIDLSVVVQNAVAATRPLLESRGHELTVGIAPGSYRMIADGTRLEQVVTNLLTNAARYTDSGGRVSVHLALEELALAGDSGSEPAVERAAVLRVRDTGRGIPADMLEPIFDMFTQVSPKLDRQNGGLGLGLTLVRRLVEMHDGRVVATSEGPGRGSELVVRLPMPSLAVPAAARPGTSPGFRKRRVLVVEDSEDVRETLKEFLESLGHEVFVAEDGVRGAARLLELSPDVALVDVGLPGIDGYEVARRVRSAETDGKHLMVALTGYGGPEVRARAEEAGFDLHVTKPVDLDWLTTFLNKANRS